MEIREVELNKYSQILYDIELASFNRVFDLTSRSEDELVHYMVGSHIFIGFENTVPVGAIVYKVQGSEIEITLLAVLPTHQRKGYAKQLLNHVLALQSNKKVWLVTHPKNSAGIITYLKSGFVIKMFKDNYYGDGEPRIMLEYSS